MAGLATVILWQIPYYGEPLLYPFTLFATYAHEMGHGLVATAIGAHFKSLEMFPDGSGLALWQGHITRLEFAMVAAGGLVGPSVAGAGVLIASKNPKRSRRVLVAIGLFMLWTAIWVGKGPFTVFFIVLTGSTLVLVGWMFPLASATFMLQLLGVQLCVALFRDIRYMFSPGGVVGGQTHNSDTAAMADALFLPYWFWGGVTALFSALVLSVGLWVALSPPKAPAKARARK